MMPTRQEARNAAAQTRGFKNAYQERLVRGQAKGLSKKESQGKGAAKSREKAFWSGVLSWQALAWMLRFSKDYVFQIYSADLPLRSFLRTASSKPTNVDFEEAWDDLWNDHYRVFGATPLGIRPPEGWITSLSTVAATYGVDVHTKEQKRRFLRHLGQYDAAYDTAIRVIRIDYYENDDMPIDVAMLKILEESLRESNGIVDIIRVLRKVDKPKKGERLYGTLAG